MVNALRSWCIGLRESAERSFLQYIHIFSMSYTLEVQAAMYEEVRQTLPRGNSELSCFSLGCSHVEKHFSFVSLQRERKYIGRVVFLPVCAIHGARERVAAEHEREFIPRPKN